MFIHQNSVMTLNQVKPSYSLNSNCSVCEVHGLNSSYTCFVLLRVLTVGFISQEFGTRQQFGT